MDADKKYRVRYSCLLMFEVEVCAPNIEQAIQIIKEEDFSDIDSGDIAEQEDIEILEIELKK